MNRSKLPRRHRSPRRSAQMISPQRRPVWTLLSSMARSCCSTPNIECCGQNGHHRAAQPIRDGLLADRGRPTPQLRPRPDQAVWGGARRAARAPARRSDATDSRRRARVPGHPTRKLATRRASGERYRGDHTRLLRSVELALSATAQRFGGSSRLTFWKKK